MLSFKRLERSNAADAVSFRMTSEAVPDDLQSVITTGRNLRLFKEVTLSAGVIIWYDYLLTFSDEVRHIWKEKKTLLSFLFLINRYWTPLSLTISLFAAFYSEWDDNQCRKFVRFKGAVTFVTVIVAEAVLILRVRAVHHRKAFTLYIQLPIYFFQIAAMIWSIYHTTAIVLPDNRIGIMSGCVLGNNPETVNIHMTVLFLLLPGLVFDLATLILLVRALGLEFFRPASLHSVLLRDGLLYFTAVFLFNLTWIITSMTFPQDLQQLLSCTAIVITNVMIGRLTLNLRSSYQQLLGDDTNLHEIRPSGLMSRSIAFAHTDILQDTPPEVPEERFASSVPERHQAQPHPV